MEAKVRTSGYSCGGISLVTPILWKIFQSTKQQNLAIENFFSQQKVKNNFPTLGRKISV